MSARLLSVFETTQTQVEEPLSMRPKTHKDNKLRKRTASLSA
jgi:hypothetical protein